MKRVIRSHSDTTSAVGDLTYMHSELGDQILPYLKDAENELSLRHKICRTEGTVEFYELVEAVGEVFLDDLDIDDVKDHLHDIWYTDQGLSRWNIVEDIVEYLRVSLY